MSPIGAPQARAPGTIHARRGRLEMSLLRRRANRALFEVFNHRSAPLRHARGAQPIRVVPRDIVINAKTLRAVCQRQGGLLGALPTV